MHKIYALKDMLIDELEKYGDKNDLSPGDLAIVDTLAHSIKNLCKVIEDSETSEYSGDMGRNRGSYRYDDGMSNARRARRDNRGRYSTEDYSRAADDVIGQLEDMLESAPDDRSRPKIRELIREMKNV